MYFFCLCSCEVLSMHIFDECDASALLVNSMCDCSYLIFLKTKYGLRKFIGVGVFVAGLILVVFLDVHASDGASKDILFIKLLVSYLYSSSSFTNSD